MVLVGADASVCPPKNCPKHETHRRIRWYPRADRVVRPYDFWEKASVRFVGDDAHIGPLESSEFVEDYHKIGPSCRGDVGIAPYAMGVCASCKSIACSICASRKTQNYFSGGAAGSVMRTSVPSP